MTTKIKKTTKKTGKKTEKKAIKSQDKAKILEDLIWSEKEQCESVCEINRGLISQYCRFAVMADELSIDIEKGMRDGTETQSGIMGKLDIYEKLSKQVLSLFKMLGLNSIKDKLAQKRNQFLAALEDDD